MIKRIQKIFKYTLFAAIPVLLYVVTYKASVNEYHVESVQEAVNPNALVASAQASVKAPTVLAKADTKTTVKKATTKKSTKKKTKKKRRKKHERLIAVPAIITPETAPHTGR